MWKSVCPGRIIILADQAYRMRLMHFRPTRTLFQSEIRTSQRTVAACQDGNTVWRIRYPLLCAQETCSLTLTTSPVEHLCYPHARPPFEATISANAIRKTRQPYYSRFA